MNRVSISDRNDASCLVTLIDDMRGGMAPYIPMAPVPLADTSLTGIVLETLLEAF
jgi:hypothetical protein